MNHPEVKLAYCLERLESGGRPKGGASLDSNGVLSIGAEHLGDDGEIKLTNPKYIPLSYFDKMNQGIIKDEDILIVKDGATTGKTNFISRTRSFETAAVNEHVFLVRTNKQILLPKFAFYYLYASIGKQQILSDFRGAAQGGISRSFANQVRFLLPPLSEQRRIVEILDQVHEIRKLRKQADEKAEKIIPALFYEMFGDVVTNDKDWPIKKLSEIAEVKRGDFRHRPRTEKRFYGGEYPFIQINDITNSNYFIDTYSQSLNDEGLKISRMFSVGTIVISIAATIASAAILKFNSCFPDSLVGINGNKEMTTQEFLLLFLRALTNKLKSEAPQLAQKNINLKILNNIDVPIPPLKLQKELSIKFNSIVENLGTSKKLFDSIDSVFIVLLSKAFDGRLTSSWRETHMKELLQEMEEQKKYLEKVSKGN